MKKIIVSNLVSLDGYFKGPNASIDWFKVDDEFLQYARDMLDSMDTLLFGRVTYQMMASYWPMPHALESDPETARRMNDLPKIVFSKTLTTVDWNNSRLVKNDMVAETKRLKQSNGSGKNMVILGSGSLVSEFSNLGLIDEYRIIVSPILIGDGTLMFRRISRRIPLKLVRTQVLGSGVVILYYHPE